MDALFLSHLDKDHISGVEYLLRNYRVKNVFLPFFTPEELLLLAAKNDVKPDCSFLSHLYTDPVDYFQHQGCQNIFLIRPAQYQSEQLNNQMPLSNIENETFILSGNIEKSSDHNNGNNQSNVYICDGSIALKLHYVLWQLKIYQDQTEAERSVIQPQIQRVLPIGATLSHIFSDKSLLKQVKKLYQSIKHGINQSSLVLYHAPESSFHAKYSGDANNCTCCHTPCRHFCNFNHAIGTLLTGDIDLKNLRNHGIPFEDFVKNQLSDVGVFLLPHHGSAANVSTNQIDSIIKPHQTVFVCSYGKQNRYKHPDAYTLNKLMVKGYCPIIHVVESEGFSYQINEY